jgi:hypothetical protein
MQLRSRPIFQSEGFVLIAILLIAAINGLLYIFIVPPWQHYDEPNHFEYVWLLAARGRLPEAGDFDTEMRRDVAQSMIEHGFFDDLGGTPDLTSEKPWIGQFTQLEEAPFYYLLASIPLRFLQDLDVNSQLYVARLVSLTFLLVTVLAGYGLVFEITPSRHPLRFLAPLTIALLPGFVDLMTAVNNDAAAVAAFSLFLWGCVRLVRRDLHWLNVIWVLATAALCLFSKRSVYVALPLMGITFLFAFLRGKFRKAAWGLVIISGIMSILVVFSWGDAALWYRNTRQNYPTRTSGSEISEGQAAFRLSLRPEDSAVKLVQIIPSDQAAVLSGKPLTLGAWIWASEPIEVPSPQFQVFDGRQVFSKPVSLTTTPQFYALTFTPQGDTRRAWVTLSLGKDLAVSNSVEIYYDGVVLAAGTFPMGEAPQFNEDATSGTWGGLPFENLLRNPSAERSWLYLRPWADQFGSKVFSDYQGQESFSLTIYTLVDFPISVEYYRSVLIHLFRTFWAQFGWAHVPVLGAKPYARLFLPLTLLAFAGIILTFWQHRGYLSRFPWDVLFLLGLALGIVWGVTFIRGSTYLLTRIFVPVARYAYPAIIPTVLLLGTGWLTLLQTLERWLRLPGWIKYVVYAGLFMGLNIYALLSITQYFG